MRFLLRPGWLALTVVVLAFAAFCFLTLAPWQLGKNTATTERNERISASFDSPPAPLAELVPAGAGPSVDDEWRLVTVTGSYLADDEVLARLRSVDGRPAYEVLTPFRTDDGRTVLVDRGYVRPVQGTQAPQVEPAPGDEVTLQARVRRDEANAEARAALTGGGLPQVYAVSAAEVATVTATTISPGWLQLSPEQPGGLGLLPLPQLDGGPFLSYGLQWIAFGVMAPLGLAYFVRAELRERRSTREQLADVPSDDAQVPDAATPPTREAVLADRYGRTR